MVESLAAGRPGNNLGGVALPLMGVTDPLESVVIATGIALLVMGGADSLEFTADKNLLLVGVANVLEIVGDTAADVITSLMGVAEMLEFVVHISPLVTGVVAVVTTNSDAILATVVTMGVALVELLIGGILVTELVLQLRGATVIIVEVEVAAVVMKVGGATVVMKVGRAAVVMKVGGAAVVVAVEINGAIATEDTSGDIVVK